MGITKYHNQTLVLKSLLVTVLGASEREVGSMATISVNTVVNCLH